MQAGYSAAAQAVIDRMSGLAAGEADAIAVFVDAEVANGNWALIDEFFCFGLTSEANALTGWISKTATNNGATKVSTGFSFVSASSQYIDSNFNPSTDGNNYTLNDALIGSYIYEDNVTGNIASAISFAAPFSSIRLNSSAKVIRINDNVNLSFADNINKALLVASRTASNARHVYVNGVNSNSDAQVSASPVCDQVIPIGANQPAAGGGKNFFFEGILSSFIIGAAIGFNHSAHNTNLTTLLTSLGVLP